MAAELGLKVGTRVTVYWPENDQWYKGTIGALSTRNENRVFVVYDDEDNEGEERWINIMKDNWRRTALRLQPLEVTSAQAKKKETISKLSVGSRMSIWFPEEKKSFIGTVTKIRQSSGENKKGRGSNRGEDHFVHYDDGDKQWIDLFHCKFQLLAHKNEIISEIREGSRVSVWWPHPKKFYPGTVTRIRQQKTKNGRDKNHFIAYDDGTNLWTDLFHSHFEVLDDSNAGTDGNDHKRKACFLQEEEEQPVDQTIPAKRVQLEKPAAVADTIVYEQLHSDDKTKEEPDVVCEEICRICECPVIHPLATACHHIFCEQCIKDHFTISKKSVYSNCPVCETKLQKDCLQEYDPQHLSYKAVEALNQDTHEVELTFNSASSASLLYPSYVTASVVRACQADQPSGHEYQGYYWRFQQCNIIDNSAEKVDHPSMKTEETAPLLKERQIGASISGTLRTKPIPVEQIDLKTGKVIHVFPSIHSASKASGLTHPQISRVCAKRGPPKAGGFFWRFQGDTHGPWAVVAIEQVCLETGEVLGVFSSIREATRETNVSCGIIQRVLQKRGELNGGGFFWRCRGEKHSPGPDPSPDRPVEQCHLETGDVLQTFDSLSDAKRAMDEPANDQSILYVILGRESAVQRESAYGYFWRWKGSDAVPWNWRGFDKVVQIVKWRDSNTSEEFHNKEEVEAFLEQKLTWSKIQQLCREGRKFAGYLWRYGKKVKPVGAVERLDPISGEVLQTFSSHDEAVRWTGLKQKSCIKRVLYGRDKTAAGFFWRRVGSTAMPVPSRRSKRRVQQLCLKTGAVLATFESVEAAAEAHGLTKSIITHCCLGYTRAAAGMAFRHAPDDVRTAAVQPEAYSSLQRAGFSPSLGRSTAAGHSSGNHGIREQRVRYRASNQIAKRRCVVCKTETRNECDNEVCMKNQYSHQNKILHGVPICPPSIGPCPHTSKYGSNNKLTCLAIHQKESTVAADYSGDHGITGRTQRVLNGENQISRRRCVICKKLTRSECDNEVCMKHQTTVKDNIYHGVPICSPSVGPRTHTEKYGPNNKLTCLVLHWKETRQAATNLREKAPLSPASQAASPSSIKQVGGGSLSSDIDSSDLESGDGLENDNDSSFEG